MLILFHLLHAKGQGTREGVTLAPTGPMCCDLPLATAWHKDTSRVAWKAKSSQAGLKRGAGSLAETYDY